MHGSQRSTAFEFKHHILYQYAILLNYKTETETETGLYASQLHSQAHGFRTTMLCTYGVISDVITCYATFHKYIAHSKLKGLQLYVGSRQAFVHGFH